MLAKKLFSLIILVLLFQTSATAQSKHTLTAIVSIVPQAYFLDRIGAGHVDVTVMVPAGGNPHTYEPSPAQLRQLEHADIYFKMGSGIDFELTWMQKIRAINPNMVVCDSSHGIKLIDMMHFETDRAHKKLNTQHVHHPGTKDPHVWLSPSNAIIIANNIKEALINIDPIHRETYENNARQLVEELMALKKDLSRILASSDQKEFLIVHPAWGYFAQEFQLRQLAIEDFGKDPTPKQLTKIIHHAKRLKAPIVFTAPQFNKKSANVIAKEIHGKVATLDHLAYDYIENLRQTAQLLGNQ